MTYVTMVIGDSDGYLDIFGVLFGERGRPMWIYNYRPIYKYTCT